MMKKVKHCEVFMLAMLATLMVLLTGCGQVREDGGKTVQVYYVSNAETKVEMHERRLMSESLEGQLEELLLYLVTNPEKLEYKAPLTLGFTLKKTELSGKKITLDMDEDYLKLPVTTEVLVRAALVRTLTQLETINYVGITVEGEPLFDSLGNQVGWMNADQFIDNDGNEINTYEKVRVKLYFANAQGSRLIAAYREKQYATSTPLERFIVEELIAGPSGQVEGLYPTINPLTKIIQVMTKDGICYVNLDDSFLVVTDNVSTELAVYSIVNSLVELNNINKVQILINGEVPQGFSAAIYERNLDIVTSLD